MKAITIPTPGGPEALVLADVPDAVAVEGEVLVDVVAAGVNRADVLQRQGLYDPPAGTAPYPGLEVSGRAAWASPHREFSRELLAATMQLDERALATALDRLIATQLVFRRGQDLAAVYVFNHALARDAAYESLLRKRRQDLHGRIANLLEEGVEAVAETRPELLAHHFANAGLGDKALRYWRAAGVRAYRSCALEESVAHYSQALECLPQWPDSEQRLELEVSLLTEQGEALMQSKGFAAPQVRQVYERAQALVAGVADSQNVSKVVFGLWAYNHVRADIAQARLLQTRGRTSSPCGAGHYGALRGRTRTCAAKPRTGGPALSL